MKNNDFKLEIVEADEPTIQFQCILTQLGLNRNFESKITLLNEVNRVTSTADYMCVCNGGRGDNYSFTCNLQINATKRWHRSPNIDKRPNICQFHLIAKRVRNTFNTWYIAFGNLQHDHEADLIYNPNPMYNLNILAMQASSSQSINDPVTDVFLNADSKLCDNDDHDISSDDSDDRSVLQALNQFNLKKYTYLDKIDKKLTYCEPIMCECSNRCLSTCLNFLEYAECYDKNCPLIQDNGNRYDCGNRRFSMQRKSKYEVIHEDEKGLGCVAQSNIRSGKLVDKYFGEIIDQNIVQDRMNSDLGE